jgi:hypothetical protein
LRISRATAREPREIIPSLPRPPFQPLLTEEVCVPKIEDNETSNDDDDADINGDANSNSGIDLEDPWDNIQSSALRFNRERDILLLPGIRDLTMFCQKAEQSDPAVVAQNTNVKNLAIISVSRLRSREVALLGTFTGLERLYVEIPWEWRIEEDGPREFMIELEANFHQNLRRLALQSGRQLKFHR